MCVCVCVCALHRDSGDINMCVALLGCTSDLGLGGVLGSWGEEQLSMFTSRQRPVLDAIVVHLCLTVLPLEGDAFVCQFHCLQVSGGIQV